jgi:hypothetical protein
MSIIELLAESKKFTNDKAFLSRLQNSENNPSNEKANTEKEPDNSFSAETITNNVIEFETSVVEAIIFLLETKREKLCK